MGHVKFSKNQILTSPFCFVILLTSLKSKIFIILLRENDVRMMISEMDKKTDVTYHNLLLSAGIDIVKTKT